MSLSLLLKLLLPVSMMTLVSCTLSIQSARDPGSGTGLGNGTIQINEIEDIETVQGAAVLGTCTFTNGAPQAGCILDVPYPAHLELTPSNGLNSEFVSWVSGCDSVAGNVCTLYFVSPVTFSKAVTAKFRRVSCTGTDACKDNSVTPGEGSCNGTEACLDADHAVGNNSCNGASACKEITVSVGNNSCNTTGSACRDATSAILDCQNNDSGTTPEFCGGG